MQPDASHSQFWQWFQRNCERVFTAMYSGDDGVRDRAVAEVRRASESAGLDLVLELARAPGGGAKQLVASADGRPERVDGVKDFVASASPLPGWEVVAFRPRMEIGDSIEIQLEGESVGPEDVWFRVAPDEGGLVLTLHVRGLTDANERLRGLGASLLAEHAVGERDVLTLLCGLHIEPLPRDPGAAGLRPFRELVPVLDAERRRKYPPPGALAVDFESDWMNMKGTIDGSLALILLHAGLRAVAGHPAYDRRLVVTFPFDAVDDEGLPAEEEEYLAVSDLGDRLRDDLQQGQGSLLAMTIMTQGRRDLVFYTSDAEAALRRVAALRATAAPHRVEAEVERDTLWAMYRTFSQAAGEPAEE